MQNLLYNSLDVAPLNQQKSDWMADWTLYYWGWWMSWSPFVGIFIARVSRGRSIREFVLAVMLVPTIISILWFSVFGVTSISIAQSAPQIFDMGPETQLFAVFNEMPLSTILSIVAILLVTIFFITSADSATFVLGMQTSFGSLTPDRKIKIIWGASLSAIGYILLLAGGENGLDALQSAAITAALPFSIVVILLVISFFKIANEERKFLGLSITPNRKRMQTYLETSPEEYDKKLETYRENQKDDTKGI